MPRRMSMPWGLKVRCYYDFPIDIKNYVGVLPDAKEKDKICMAELDDFFVKQYTQHMEQAVICAGIWLWTHYF